MEGLGMGLTPVLVLVRCPLGFLSLSGPIADTSWTHDYSKNSLVLMKDIIHL